MKIIVNPSPATWPDLCRRPQMDLEFLEGTVRNILLRVKSGGDAALREFSRQYDHTDVDNLSLSAEAVQQAEQQTEPELARSIRLAAANIERFHSAQLIPQPVVETMPGVTCWRKAVPIEKVGLYIPGGTAPLFSTVLMLGIPARLARCREIIMCTPPDKEGKINPAIVFAAQVAGVKKIFKVGGAQAIAAMAYGTESIPAVDKIFGPGNQYVTKAKEMVAREGVAIDLPAGPSEVLVWADFSADPSFAAADLLSQAEHGEDSQIILVCDHTDIAERILHELNNQLHALPRRKIAEKALSASRVIVFEQTEKAAAFINTYAPEHLIINTTDAEQRASAIRNAGSVFLGNFTPEAAGDYASGTNHTLPTNGFARICGGVSMESFVKYITYQLITPQGLQHLGPAVICMAEAESLSGHAEAIRVRLNQLNKL